MAEISRENVETIHVLEYDPNWPNLFMAEREFVSAAIPPRSLSLKDIGSIATRVFLPNPTSI
jgi:GrpB-like predicted nucleotidyltransferase (UPF0157 family)